MSVGLVIVLVVLGVLLLLALLGGARASRRNRAGAGAFTQNLTAVDRQLAAAVAEDHGWQRDTLEAAARSEFATHRPGAEIAELALTEIRDEPGTDQDLAVFRVRTTDAAARLTLGRRDGAWYAASVQDE